MMVPRVPPGLFSINLSSIDDVLRARLHSSHLQSTPSGPAARPAVQALAALAGWAGWAASETMSIRHPVSFAARRAFWPSLPIARDSW